MSSVGTIQAIADELLENFEAERCTIRLPRGKKLKVMVARRMNDPIKREIVDITDAKETVDIAGTIAGDALTTGMIQNIPDITQDKRYDPTYISHNGAKALIAVPMIYEGQRLGVAQLYRQRPFDIKEENVATMLAAYAATTLWHIEISKMNRQAILDIFMAVLLADTFSIAFNRVAEEISRHLLVPRCVIYRVNEYGKEFRCQITAGVPEGEHEIGLSETLDKHPDIESVVNEKQALEITEPLSDNRTAHLRTIIEKKHINSILYVPALSGARAIGVIVLDATDEKDCFSAEEKSFVFDISRIVGCLFDHEKKQAEELEHEIMNPSVALSGWAARFLESVTQTYETAIDVCQHRQTDCEGAAKMFKNILELMRNTAKIETDGKKIGSLVRKVRQTKFG